MGKQNKETFVDVAREFIKLVTGELQPFVTEKITVLIDSDSKISFFTPAHMQFAKYGRGPGKQPPINNIIDFVKKKGIIFEDKDAEGTAWAIAKSIAKNGTLNWKPNAPDAIEEALEKHNEKYIKLVAEFTRKKTLEELQLIYEDQFKDQTFKI